MKAEDFLYRNRVKLRREMLNITFIFLRSKEGKKTSERDRAKNFVSKNMHLQLSSVLYKEPA